MNQPDVVDRNGDFFCREAQFSSNCLGQGPCAKVSRSRLDSSLRDEDGTRLFGSRFVFLDHLVNPSGFASNIYIVSASLSTSLPTMLALETVGSNGSDGNASLLCY